MEKDSETVRRKLDGMSAVRKKNVTQLQSTYITNQDKHEQFIKRKRRGLYRRLLAFTIIVLIFSYGIISTLISQSAHIEEKLSEKKVLEAKMAELQEEQVVLEEEIVKLNDDNYIAKIARRDYFLSEEGETIFKIVEED
jgi:cell division protein DivIC